MPYKQDQVLFSQNKKMEKNSMSTLVQQQNRIRWLDITKAICIIAVVIGHVYHNNIIRIYTLSFSVPAFFFFSGYCYHHPPNKVNFIIKKSKQSLYHMYHFQ